MRTSASPHAAIAMARAIPGRPNGLTRITASVAVHDHRSHRGGDRRDGVLAGVEGSGEHGDHRVSGQPTGSGQGDRDDLEVGRD